MKNKNKIRMIRQGLISLLLFSFVGCGGISGSREHKEENHPLILEAMKLKDHQDPEGAVKVLHKALRKHPDLAYAHLQLGFIYDDMRDYISAIYHYRQYLGARPDAEKNTLLQRIIEDSENNFRKNKPIQAVDMPEHVRRLQSLNATLRKQNDELTLEVGELKALLRQRGISVPDSGSRGGGERARPEAPAGLTRYKVQTGDTLSSISSKMYGNTRDWKKIYQANKSTLPREDRLTVGQELKIPR